MDGVKFEFNDVSLGIYYTKNDSDRRRSVHQVYFIFNISCYVLDISIEAINFINRIKEGSFSFSKTIAFIVLLIFSYCNNVYLYHFFYIYLTFSLNCCSLNN